MTRFVTTIAMLLLAVSAYGAAAARDAYIPIAGRATGAGGRRFDTTVWITNTSDVRASLTLSFLRSAQANPQPFTYTQRLAPHEVRRITLPDYLLGTAGVGALRVQSSQDVLATAHVFSVVEGQSEAGAVGAVIDAVPADRAIGTAETTLVPGVATPGARFKLYAVETTAHPLYFTATLIDDTGASLRQKRYFIGSREARTFDVASEFGEAAQKAVAMRLHGVNGSGRIVACGVAVAAESQDSAVFAMSVPRSPRHRLAFAEIAAYVMVAVTLVATALGRRQRHGAQRRVRA